MNPKESPQIYHPAMAERAAMLIARHSLCHAGLTAVSSCSQLHCDTATEVWPFVHNMCGSLHFHPTDSCIFLIKQGIVR